MFIIMFYTPFETKLYKKEKKEQRSYGILIDINTLYTALILFLAQNTMYNLAYKYILLYNI